MIGCGKISFGLQYAGRGVETPASSISNDLFIKSDGQVGTGRFLNPITNDYVLSNGNFIGTTSASQRILLALKTLRDSSSIPGFGLTFNQTTTIPGVIGKIQSDVRDALKHITDIQIEKLQVNRNNSRIEINLQYLDLSTNKLENLVF